MIAFERRGDHIANALSLLEIDDFRLRNKVFPNQEVKNWLDQLSLEYMHGFILPHSIDKELFRECPEIQQRPIFRRNRLVNETIFFADAFPFFLRVQKSPDGAFRFFSLRDRNTA